MYDPLRVIQATTSGRAPRRRVPARHAPKPAL